MKILYYSDKYTYGVMGTKRSIFEEMQRRGHTMIWMDKAQIVRILQDSKRIEPDQIWLAHSGLTISRDTKKKLGGVVVVGFGFSDPYYFKEMRMDGYDAYVTNHVFTQERFSKRLPTHYNPTACDTRFHKNLNIKEKLFDASIIGCGRHPRFPNKVERIEFLTSLRRDLPDFSFHAFGQRWNTHSHNHSSVSESAFLNVINQTRLGLDIQADFSPLAHRMFEYSSCGTPIITRDRPEVLLHMQPDKDILTYTGYDDLKDKIRYYLTHPDELHVIGRNAYERVRKEHDVKNRVDAILGFVRTL